MSDLFSGTLINILGKIIEESSHSVCFYAFPKQSQVSLKSNLAQLDVVSRLCHLAVLVDAGEVMETLKLVLQHI